MRCRQGSGGALRRRMASAGWRAIRPVPRPPMRFKDLRREAGALKECVADLTLENRLLKKSILADGEDGA